MTFPWFGTDSASLSASVDSWGRLYRCFGAGNNLGKFQEKQERRDIQVTNGWEQESKNKERF